MVGQTLGHYRILDKLGAGGMGEVYRAEDTTLKRQVALKILPAELASSQERLERFQREAESLASLNHPNIVHIYTVEEAEGIRFLTMELVEGKALSQVISQGGLPLERIFEIAVPLADALAKAHEQGIIHRDLKPANIMLTDEGRVKVLDFGLAKLRQPESPAGAPELPTEPLTEAGKILGTVPYMSPEQVEGKELDHRSDLFSLGVILYEMATGERPFDGDSAASVMSAILRDTPSSVTDLKGALPRDLAKIIRRCLVKEPESRFQTARELAIELEELRSEVDSGEAWGLAAPPAKQRRVGRWFGLGAAGLVLLAALGVVLWSLQSDRKTAEDEPTTGSATFTKLVFDTARKGKMSASPDGRYFAYASNASGNWDIYLQRIGGGNAINLTEDSTEDDKQPAYSPDGEWIAFRSERDGGGIFIMGATGESVRRVVDHGFLPAWSPDGTKIVFSTSGKLGGWLDNLASRIWIVNVGTAELTLVLDHSAIMPAWSPNGSRIAFQGWWEPLGTEMQNDLFTVDAGGGEPLSVTRDVHYEDSPAWSPDGRSLYYASASGGAPDLWRVPIEEERGRVLGAPVPITSGSSVGRHVSPTSDGSRVLVSSEIWTSEIFRVPFDPIAEKVVGPPVSITSPGLQAWNPSVSPDGEWIAFDAEFGQPGYMSIGVARTDGSEVRQLTYGEHRDRYPRWSPDGRRLTFWGSRSGRSQAWIINRDGSGMRQLTNIPELSVTPAIWSPDGLQLATTSIDGKTTYIFQHDRSWSEAPPTELPPFGGPDDQFSVWSWSPDGKLLAGSHAIEVGVEHPALYSLETGRYLTPADEISARALWVTWLNDSRRLLINAQSEDSGTIFLLDTVTGEYHEILSSESLSKAAGPTTTCPAVSADNQSLYVARLQLQNDIWMLTLGEQE